MRSVNAVITGADVATGLMTGRALKRITDVNVRVTGLYSNPGSHFLKSGVWDEIVPLKSGEEGLVADLIRVGNTVSGGMAVLFPTQDFAVKIVSEQRGDLEPYFHFVLPKKESVALLMNKIAFHRFAAERNLPVPKAIAVSNRCELEAVLENARYPVVIKPAMRSLGWDQKRPKDKVFKIGAKGECARPWMDHLFDDCEEALVQEWIDGPDTNIHFCLLYVDRNGIERGYYAGRKLIQWPLECGSTAVCVGTVNVDLLGLTREVLGAAAFRGLGSLEVKIGEQDGKYYIMEPTVGRNNLQSYIAVAGGVNLTEIALKDALGRSWTHGKIRTHRAMWVDEYSTLEAVKNKGRLQDLLTIVRNGLGCKVSAVYFNIKDPGPLWSLLTKRARQSLQRLLRRIRLADAKA